jgi:hypothetical protein
LATSEFKITKESNNYSINKETCTLCLLYAVYSSPNIIRVIKSRRLRSAGHVAGMGERRGAYRALVGKPEGRRPLQRPRRRWKDNIKMALREVGWGRRLD